ncbi:MAG: hypothetical protein C5B57_08660 [Blastocatellia bacterium]|nr:MAG: hypothetical protein C5B57_08660 [Blastocatellia bacterium]
MRANCSFLVCSARVGSLTCLIVLSCGVAAPVWAQGYSLYQQGSCAMGRAGAGVASPCDDGSAIFFNPAGLASARATILSVGATAVPPRGTFTDDIGKVSALNTSTTFAPTIYFARPVGRRLTIGAGMFAPYGLASDWPAASEGRFIGYYSSVKSVYVQPTVAMQLSDRIQIGAGFDITYLSVELKNRLDLASVPMPGAAGATFQVLGVPSGTDFADLDLTGSGTTIGGHFGVIANASKRVSLGARYLMRQTSHIKNGQLATSEIPTGLALRSALPGMPAGTPIDTVITPQFTAGHALASQSATTSLPLPDQLVMGTALRATRQLTLFADYQFTNWSLFNELDIHNQVAPETTLPQKFVNTHGVRVAGEYELARAITLRGGFDTYTAAAPDESVTPVIPDAPRREYSVGATIRTSGHTAIDLAYQFVNQQNRRGRATDGGLAVPTSDLNNGTYHMYANMLGASWSLRF